MKHLCLPLSVAAALGVCLGAPLASAQERTPLGVLTCTIGADDGAQARMTCGFRPSKVGGAEERYVGTLIDAPIAAQTDAKRVLVWTVFGLGNGRMEPGSLSQRYRIATEARALIGERRPLALEAETSNGSSAGVTQLELKHAPSAI